MKIPELIKIWRKFHDLSQREMAIRLGIPFQTLSRIEKGDPMGLETYLAIERWMRADD
jgi:transcriptional regulator with XRE-family HTH domain